MPFHSLLLCSCPRPDRQNRAAFQEPAHRRRDDQQAGGRYDDEGTFVIDLRPDLAPNHVGYFIKLARDGAYNGTMFHRVIRLGIIQGGDPLSKDPAKAKLYGTGGLGVLKAEIGGEQATRGAVAAVLQPGKPDSGGVAVLRLRDGSAVARRQVHDLRARVRGHGCRAEDLGDARQRRRDDRPSGSASCRSTIRDTPPPEPEPFARRRRGHWRSTARCSRRPPAPITIEFLPDKAPEHVRNFLRLASAGVLDGTAFHRVVQGFVVQTGWLSTRGAAHRKAAEARPPAAAGVQRHEAREGHRVDGARRRSRQRDDLVLHRDRGRAARSTANTRRSAGSSTGWPWSTRSSRRRSRARAPVSRIELKQVRIVKYELQT